MFCGGVVVLQAFDAGLVAEDGGDLFTHHGGCEETKEDGFEKKQEEIEYGCRMFVSTARRVGVR